MNHSGVLIIIIILMGINSVLIMTNTDDRAKQIITAIQSNGCTNSQLEPIVPKERRETYNYDKLGGLK